MEIYQTAVSYHLYHTLALLGVMLFALVRSLVPPDVVFMGGLVTVVDDSHGLGAYGATGRGTEEFCRTPADITVGTESSTSLATSRSVMPRSRSLTARRRRSLSTTSGRLRASVVSMLLRQA